MTPSEQHPAGAESATELLSRRAQLKEWLERLDDVDDDIPAQVTRRVRADYEQRLAAVVAELSAHSEALSADRERLDEQLLADAERHDAAMDVLEETRLRHRIGELSTEDWDGRRPALEAELEAAAASRAATEQEIAALEALFAQIAAGAPSTASSYAEEATLEAGTSQAEPELDRAGESGLTDGGFAEAADEWMPDLPVLEESPQIDAVPVSAEPEALPEMEAVQSTDEGAGSDEEEAPLDVSAYGAEAEESKPVDDDLVEITNFAAAAEALADEVDPAPADEDYAFLQELDRAIAATAPNSSEDEEAEADTRPQPGLKCPDCGYSNDPAAWYCGVCGVDLG